MSDDEKEIDEVKLGSHSIDTTPVSAIKSDDEDGHIPFQIETEAVFKRLARDIYEDDSAGIREPVTNAVAAVLRAVEHDYITKDEGIIEINVREEGSVTKLKIRDNGIGMSMKTIKKIISVIGVSESRDLGDLPGQFGMGFLAVFRLVGVSEGGFEMSTNPRYTDEEPITGIWKSGGFTRDTENLLTDGLSQDEYGTEFNFILKDSISRTKIREWVSDYCEWARVPVIYEETVDGKVDFEENYGGFDKNINSYYSDEKKYVEFKDEYFNAYSSPDSTEKTILLDVPCERYSSNNIETILGSVDVRLKNENGVIVKGPNEGKMVVAEGEYDGMDDSRKNKYIPDTKVEDKDIKMPQPVGTRRVLESNTQFWDYVKDKIQSKIVREVEDIMNDVNKFSDLMNLDEDKYKLIIRCANQNVNVRYGRDLDIKKAKKEARKWFDKKLSFDISDEIAEVLGLLCYDGVRFAEEGTEVGTSRKNPMKIPASECYKAYNNGGDVYMGCRLTQDKADLIWEDNQHNYLFEIEGTEFYDDYESILNWERLKDIEEDNFDVSEKLKQKVFGESSKTKSKSGYTLKLHSGKGSHSTTDKTVEKLKEIIENPENSNSIVTKVNNIVLFPSHIDKNISDHYWMANSYTLIAKCRKKDWLDLQEYDLCVKPDEIVEKSKNVEFLTSKGEYTLKTIDLEDNEKLFFHIIPEPYISDYADYMSDIENIVNEKYAKRRDIKYVYAPIKAEKLKKLHPEVKDHAVGSVRKHSISTQAEFKKIMSNTSMYAKARLKKWEDTTEYDTCNNSLSIIDLDSGGYEIVESIYNGLNSEGPVEK